jgi:hypothetical protein
MKTNCLSPNRTNRFDIYHTWNFIGAEGISKLMNMKTGFKIEKSDSHHQSQTFELNPNSSIIEQFQEIEDYLQTISKRLDRLEVAISRRERQIIAKQNSSVSSHNY